MRNHRKEFADHFRQVLSRADITPTELQHRAKHFNTKHGGHLAAYLRGDRNLSPDDLLDYVKILERDCPGAVEDLLSPITQCTGGRVVMIPATLPEHATPQTLGHSIGQLVTNYMHALSDGILDRFEKEDLKEEFSRLIAEFFAVVDEQAA